MTAGSAWRHQPQCRRCPNTTCTTQEPLGEEQPQPGCVRNSRQESCQEHCPGKYHPFCSLERWMPSRHEITLFELKERKEANACDPLLQQSASILCSSHLPRVPEPLLGTPPSPAKPPQPDGHEVPPRYWSSVVWLQHSRRGRGLVPSSTSAVSARLRHLDMTEGKWASYPAVQQSRSVRQLTPMERNIAMLCSALPI